MPCASQLPTHSPASDRELTFMFMRMWAAAAADDSLIPGLGPPCWGPPFVWADRRRSDWGETSGNPQSPLRFLGAVKRFVQAIQIWWSFPCSALQRGFCQSVWIMSPSIFLICARTTDARKAVFALGPWCQQKVLTAVLNSSLVTNQGERGSVQLLWKRQETGKQEEKKEKWGWNELQRGVTSV